MKRLQHFLRERIDIREGEEGRVLLMFGYIFLIVTALMIVKPVANSLFISHFGVARLPYVFIFVAVGAAAVSSLYSRWIASVDMFRLMSRTLQFSIGSLLFFRIVLLEAFIRDEMLFVFFVFYVWTAVYGLITASQFWILANCIFNPREAKRLFGFVGAGAIVGGIFGGYLTRLLAPVLGSANLLLICAGCLLISIGIIRKLSAMTVGNEHLQQMRQKEQAVQMPKKPLRTIMESRHLLFLAGIIGISVVVGKLVEYQFSAVASSRITNPDHLTAFFGFWLSNLNVASLLVQIFATRWAVSVLGVGTSLLFLPVTILAGAALLLGYPVLWAAIILKMADGSMKNSINKAALELTLLPLPAAVKKQAKAFIDVFVDSAATGIGGIMLLSLTAFNGLSIRSVAVVTILFSCIWCYLAVRIRREYIQSFRQSLAGPASTENTEPATLKSHFVIDNLTCAFQHDDEEQILKALRLAHSIQEDRLLPCFRELIRHGSPRVRMEVLKNAYFYKRPEFMEDARALLFDTLPFDPDQDVKTEAMHYLFRHSGANRVELLKTFLTSEDHTISAAALLCSARESRRNTQLKSLLTLPEILERRLQDIPQIEDPDKELLSKITCAGSIGAANIPAFFPYLHIFINDENCGVVKAAIQAAGESRHPAFIPVLITRMQEATLEKACGEAIKQYGPTVIGSLFQYLDNPFVDRDIRQRIPQAVALLKSQPAVDLLIENLDQSDPSIRFGIIRGLNRLHLDGENLKFDEQKISRCILDEAKRHMSLLLALYHQLHQISVAGPVETAVANNDIATSRKKLAEELEHRLDENLERIFRLLGLRYPTEDIVQAYQGVRSERPDIRSSAVEFLDNVLETDMKRTLIPILESSLIDTVIEEVLEKLGVGIPSERNALETMLPEADPPLQVLALQLIEHLGDRRFAGLAGEMANSPSPEVQEAAIRILKNIGYLKRGIQS